MKFIHDALAKRNDDDQGFTLIELLVVVIIIGIMAAIAIPVFLNQREKAWDSAAKSDVRNAQTAMETYFTDNSSYTGATIANLGTDYGFSESDSVLHNVCADGASSYVVVAKHESGGEFWVFDSSTGQLTSQAAAPAAADGFSCTPAAPA